METKIIVGFFVGILCGIIPLFFGFFNKSKFLGVLGTLASAGAGILFNVLDKSPFSALVVAVLFVFIIIVNMKRLSHKNEDDDDDDDLDSDIT